MSWARDRGVGEAPQTKRPKIMSLHPTILAIQKYQPYLEKSLSEIVELKEIINELKEKLLRKEKEVTKAMRQNSAVLEQVFGGSDLEEGDLTFERNEQELKVEIEEVEQSEVSETNTSSTLAQFSTESESEMESIVADLTKSSKAEMVVKLISLEELLSKTRDKKDCAHREIEERNRTLEGFHLYVEEREQMKRECEARKNILREKTLTLEREMEAISLKYCAMNEELNGISQEESVSILQSAHNFANQSYSDHDFDALSRSPLLKKYVGITRDLCENVNEMTMLDLRINDIEVGDQSRLVEEERETLRCDQELIALLEEEHKLMAELKDCQTHLNILEILRGDQLAALKWAQFESHGLYHPTLSTAPMILLLFQQYCRQLACTQLKKGEVSKVVTPQLLRRFGCTIRMLTEGGYTWTDIREAGYSGREARDAGFSAPELRQGGYTVGELRWSELGEDDDGEENEVGDVDVEEEEEGEDDDDMEEEEEESDNEEESDEEDGSCSWVDEVDEEEDLPGVGGFSVAQLISAGYSVEELRAGGVSAKELRGKFLMVVGLKEGGYTMSEVQEAGYAAEDAQAEGFTVDDLRTAGYPTEEIIGAGYTLQELVAQIPVSELVTTTLIEKGGFCVKQLQEAGFTIVT
jgi:hypothetical protein